MCRPRVHGHAGSAAQSEWSVGQGLNKERRMLASTAMQGEKRARRQPCSSPQARTLRVAESVRSLLGPLAEGRALGESRAVPAKPRPHCRCSSIAAA